MIVHYGLGVTDCGIDVDGVRYPQLAVTTSRTMVTCCECLDALAHMDAKIRRCSSPAPPSRGEDD